VSHILRFKLFHLLRIGMLFILPCLAWQVAAAPNILLIFADDLGVEALGSYGGQSYQTPALDRFAAQSMRFENAHATPLCTPSRVMLLTGKDSWRNYTDFGYLAPGETTFAHIVRERGYRTMAAGKWQLVSNKYQDLHGATPQIAGFDEYAMWQIAAREDETDRYWSSQIEINGEVVASDEDDYAPNQYLKSLSEFIQRSSDSSQPFLAYYSMILPHRPFSATPDHEDSDDLQENFVAMVGYMDTVVGRLLAVLARSGAADNTVVMFIGDNGTDRKISSRRLGQVVVGGKGQTLQSSTHVPFLVRWPGHVAPGTARSELVYLADILPTLAEMVIYPDTLLPADLPDNIDGSSLVPLLLPGPPVSWRDSLFMHYDPRWSDNKPARYTFDDRWKLYEDGQFFDIKKDGLEQSAIPADALSHEGSLARERLQRRLDAAGGELSGVESPQSSNRQSRNTRRTFIVIAIFAAWVGWRRFRKSTIS
jgi:arylsulfatase A